MRFFTLTNDPDHGKTEDYRKILKFLAENNIFVTTAVFCILKNDKSLLSKHCYTGETNTLADEEYKNLMLEAKDWGHEIAYHGYSQVSDTREEFQKGLEIFNNIFSEYPKVFFEHGGHKSFHHEDMIKKENLSMYGSDKSSIYYVRDIIKNTFDVVWTHDFLQDNVKTALSLQDIFVTVDGITYVKRWRMFHFNDIKGTVNNVNNSIVGYTHFGYKGYRRRFNFIKNYFDKNSYLERWLYKNDLKITVGIIKNYMKDNGIDKSLTTSQLYKHYCNLP